MGCCGGGAWNEGIGCCGGGVFAVTIVGTDGEKLAVFCGNWTGGKVDGGAPGDDQEEFTGKTTGGGATAAGA